MTALSMLLHASSEPASVPGGGVFGRLCQLAEAHQAVLIPGSGMGCIDTSVSERSCCDLQRLRGPLGHIFLKLCRASRWMAAALTLPHLTHAPILEPCTTQTP